MMVLKMKKIFWGFTEKSDFQGGGGVTKNQYRGGDCLKRGLGQFANLRRGLGKKKGGGVFEVGLILQCTL